MALDAVGEAPEHSAVGGKIKGKGTAERHMVFGHAAPQRRCDDDRDRQRGGCRGPATDPFAQHAVDTHRQVRTVLLDRGDGQQDNGVGGCLLAKLGGGQLLPYHRARHQYVTLRSMKRNCSAVSAITMTIRITDCAAELPRSPPSRPSKNTL